MKKIILFVLLLLTNFCLAETDSPDSLKNIKKVLFVVTMNAEAQPIIRALKLQPSSTTFANLPMRSYSGKYNDIQIFLIRNGEDPVNNVQNVGSQAATLAAYIGIQSFHPDLVINVGTAGGNKKSGAKLKDIYLSKKIYFYDRRIPLPGYHEYGLGDYSSANIAPLVKLNNFKVGNVCSGDSFQEDLTDYKIITEQNCAAVDMEAAGIAWVSMLMKTPMVAIKGITDYIDDNNSSEQFKNNFSSVSELLANSSLSIIKVLANKTY